jgi:1,2-diacylglycerol-3-alpha-glucose alpha-1,2-galactosyltransferase
VNVVSESAFSVGGHGVHTAFLEHVDLVRSIGDARATVNSWRPADIQHVHTVGPFAATQLIRARRRSVMTAHLTPGSLRGSLVGDERWANGFMKYVVACYNLAGVVAAVSRHEATELLELGVRRPIEVIPNTVDIGSVRELALASPAARQRYNIPSSKFVIVGVGQMQPRKDLQTFLRCAQLNPDALFYWVGGKVFGPATAQSKQTNRLVRSASHNVTFTGVVTRSEVIRYLSAADLFFLPSRHENCPMAVLEAAALGLPLLLRDLPQYSDLLGDGCLYGDDENFPSLIQRTISDPGLRSKLSIQATAIAGRFDSKLWAPGLLALYLSLR